MPCHHLWHSVNTLHSKVWTQRNLFNIFLFHSQGPPEAVHHYGADALGFSGGGLWQGAERGLTWQSHHRCLLLFRRRGEKVEGPEEQSGGACKSKSQVLSPFTWNLVWHYLLHLRYSFVTLCLMVRVGMSVSVNLSFSSSFSLMRLVTVAVIDITYLGWRSQPSYFNPSPSSTLIGSILVCLLAHRPGDDLGPAHITLSPLGKQQHDLRLQLWAIFGHGSRCFLMWYSILL